MKLLKSKLSPKGVLTGLRQILATESSLKMMKNTFLFHLKSSFHSQDIESFCLDFLVMYWNGLINKIRLISNFMTSQSIPQLQNYSLS